jgi:hypothetical protein
MEEMGSLAARWVLDALDRAKIEGTKSGSANVDSATTDEVVEEIPAPLGTLHLLPAELVIRDSTARLLK